MFSFLSRYTEFQKECLAAHNTYRAKHKVPALVLNKKMCDYAQEWANDISKRAVLQHRSESKYGENIYYFHSTDPNHVVHGNDAVDAWYNEIEKHIFNQEPKTTGTGHFTQVVWKTAKELGVGVAKNSKGQVFVVANYDPAGNWIGKYAENVPPVGGFK